MKNVLMRVVLFVAVAALGLAPMAQAQTYTSDTNVAHFTAEISTYATFSNYSGFNGSCGPSPFTPTSSELATTSCRVFTGTLTGTGLSSTNNWIEATFPQPVSTIVVFPNIDHFGSAYDGFQYQIAGSNDGATWTMLYDAQTVTGAKEPFTLGMFTGTAPTSVNNVLTPPSAPIGGGCSVPNPPPCEVGYIATFNFGTAYKFYAFGASSEAISAGNADQELSAVGSTLPRGQVTITAANQSGNTTTYTYTLATGTPDLVAGEDVIISGMADPGSTCATPSGTPLPPCNNGAFIITSVSDPSFTVTNRRGFTASSQNGTLTFSPQSGALLTIKSTDGTIDIHVYDSQIHSGSVLKVPAGSGLSNCNTSDQFSNDADVLQGGSLTGCDAGDPFEVTDGNNAANTHQAFGKTDKTLSAGPGSPALPGNGFHIETHYLCGAAGASPANPTVCSGGITSTTPACNTSGTICANPDSGFLTVTNNTGAAFSGTITLQGNSPICGNVSDSSNAGLASSASVTLALAADSSSCGGFTFVQNVAPALSSGATSSVSFGGEAFRITPLSITAAANDTFGVLPVPIPAGPLGLNPWAAGNFGTQPPPENPVAFSPLRFSATNFPNQACIPHFDFSALNNPMCVELRTICTSAGVVNGGPDCPILSFMEVDYSIDSNSLPGGIGGPHGLIDHADDCVTSNFDRDIFFEYMATTPGTPDNGFLSDHNSCIVNTFEPAAQPIAAGTTFAIFAGFQSPVVDTTPGTPIVLNMEKAGRTLPLIFQYNSSPGVPVTNLSWCPDGPTTFDGPVCKDAGVNPPWIFLAQTPIHCPNNATDSLLAETAIQPNSSGFQPNTPTAGTYQFNWQTPSGETGCVAIVVEFDTGMTLFPAYVQFTH